MCGLSPSSGDKTKSNKAPDKFYSRLLSRLSRLNDLARASGKDQPSLWQHYRCCSFELALILSLVAMLLQPDLQLLPPLQVLLLRRLQVPRLPVQEVECSALLPVGGPLRWLSLLQVPLLPQQLELPLGAPVHGR